MGRLSLKRAREEQGAPMAPRARNPPSPPVAVPAARAQPDLGDAIQLVLAVKREFAGVPGKYEEFLAVLQEHRSIGVAAVIDRVKVLLAGHRTQISSVASTCSYQGVTSPGTCRGGNSNCQLISCY
ncbi:hypothetical protein PVAP13_6KG159106 [Panicum virgatum]|uniref:Uncharacterized protein n=1 Tax=Panicum virgatum TaxID=38727 RepID=A0A8T0RBE0_PANVG|nr:hypothetical protein PVAP13_6KG159106 [Panicum virgatum]